MKKLHAKSPDASKPEKRLKTKPKIKVSKNIFNNNNNYYYYGIF